CSSFSGVRPIRARRAPSDFSSCAVQRPMPEPPPVTLTVRPGDRPGRERARYCMVRDYLTLRRARSARLEGWATADLFPPFETRRFAALLRVSFLVFEFGGLPALRPLGPLCAQEGRELLRRRADGVGAQV